MIICYLGSGYRDLGQVNQSYNLFSVKNYSYIETQKIYLKYFYPIYLYNFTSKMTDARKKEKHVGTTA